VAEKKTTTFSTADSITGDTVPQFFTLEQWRVLASQTGYDVRQLASLPIISCSVRSLERLFRRNFAATPSHYLKLWRAQDACAYIGLTGASNKQAAAKFDFYDEAHLCHVVKQMLARTPQSYLPSPTKLRSN
jgi:transcriptional regulator GlxA family with amidase domain